MADSIVLKLDNVAGFRKAAELAPKTVKATIAREAKREGDKFRTAYRKGFLLGPPGINLPRRLASFTKGGQRRFKKRRSGEAKGTQLAHVKTKVVVGPKATVLVAYLSRFLLYHRRKLEAPFFVLFRRHEAVLRTRIVREMARITQAVLDKGLRDARRGGP